MEGVFMLAVTLIGPDGKGHSAETEIPADAILSDVLAVPRQVLIDRYVTPALAQVLQQTKSSRA